MGFLTRCKRLFSFAFLLQNRNTFFSFFLKSFLILSEKQHPALDFHSIVAEMSHNKFLKNLLDILVFEEKRVEARMEILATRERGGIYVVQHDDIAAAIEAHDGPLASQLMSQHMDLILRTVEEQITQIKETELQNSMTGVAEISAV